SYEEGARNLLLHKNYVKFCRQIKEVGIKTGFSYPGFDTFAFSSETTLDFLLLTLKLAPLNEQQSTRFLIEIIKFNNVLMFKAIVQLLKITEDSFWIFDEDIDIPMYSSDIYNYLVKKNFIQKSWDDDFA